MINIQRNFKPIGQGAFYEENVCVGMSKSLDFRKNCTAACRMYYCTHNEICMENVATDTKTIIYDCGTKSSDSDAILEGEIRRIKSDIIDILFISHFDDDHINGVPHLLNLKKVKNVVLPQINNEAKYLCMAKAISSEKEVDYIELILDTRGYLEDRDVNVIEVEPATLESRIKIEDSRSILDKDKIDEIGAVGIGGTYLGNFKSIKSGETIKSCNIDWGWIPFNIDYIVNKSNLEKGIKLLEKKYKGLINSDGSINDDYILKNINDTDFKQDIVDIYKNKLTRKGTNENSLVLYSGPIFCNSARYTFLNTPSVDSHKTGCLYCGDYNAKIKANLFKLKNYYKDVWSWIGTIQIPHHGSKYNFPIKKVDELLKGIQIAVISSGKDTSHPHKEVTDLLSKYVSKCYNVTEHIASRHRQCIWRN